MYLFIEWENVWLVFFIYIDVDDIVVSFKKYIWREYENCFYD